MQFGNLIKFNNKSLKFLKLTKDFAAKKRRKFISTQVVRKNI